jgi:hypothetical protein
VVGTHEPARLEFPAKAEPPAPQSDGRGGPPESAPAGGGAPRGFDPAASVEDIYRRGPSSKTFRNPDGSFTSKIFSRPVHFQDPAGEWAEYDPTLEERPDRRIRTRSGQVHVDVAPRADDAALAAVDFGAGRRVAFRLAGARPALVERTGVKAIYRRAVPRVDLELEATSAPLAPGGRRWVPPASSKNADDPIEPNLAPCDLYCFGNRSGPRAPRPGVDIDVDAAGMVRPTKPPTGASAFGDPGQAPLTGHYHRIPAGTQLPPGLRVVADGADVGGRELPTHHTIYPSGPMALDDFTQQFLDLPWEYAGKK